MFDNNQIHEGLYKNNELNGYGRIFFPSGQYYIGMFKNNDYHGKGIRVFPDGRVEDGIFRENKLISYEWTKQIAIKQNVGGSGVVIIKRMAKFEMILGFICYDLE